MTDAVLRNELDHMASLGNMLCEAWRDPDSPEALGAHRIMEGLEFAVMRAAWLLGEPTEALRIHKLIGDHSPNACPICNHKDAFNASTDGDPVATESTVGGVS